MVQRLHVHSVPTYIDLKDFGNDIVKSNKNIRLAEPLRWLSSDDTRKNKERSSLVLTIHKEPGVVQTPLSIVALATSFRVSPLKKKLPTSKPDKGKERTTDDTPME